jgi:two-component system OmpR family sensor kinase
VVVSDEKTKKAYGPEGPLPSDEPERIVDGGRVFIALGVLAGSVPVIVSVPDAKIVLLPPIATLGHVAAIAGLLAFAVVALVGFALFLALESLAREALRPLRETTAALRRLAQRDFTPRTIVADERSEVGELAHAYTAAAATVARALEERRLAEAEMQRFVADAGHELRTPLTVVVGVIDLLEGGGLDPSVSARLYAGVKAETRRMRGTLEKLIVLARLGAPADEPELTPVDLAAVARDVTESLRVAAPTRRLIVREFGTTPAVVLADENDLYEAVFNCVENALNYGGTSDVTVRVRTTANEVLLDVRDRGPGMPAADRLRAFERFYRGEETRDIAGSGLGLAIVKRAVEKCGGSVTLRSEPGRGTLVSLRVPLAPAEAGHALATLSRRAGEAARISSGNSTLTVVPFAELATSTLRASAETSDIPRPFSRQTSPGNAPGS